jgi:tRNA uridine 5-carbamoylmethylation protein Kti12
MITLYIFCGIPASGKSTLSKQITKEHNAERISFDERNYMRHAEMIPPIIEALTNGKNVVADSVYHRVKQRTAVLDAVKDIPCRKILICMDTSLEECLQRNANRENRLPDFMVESFHQTFEQPTLSEGWDEIIIVKEDGSHEIIYEDYTQRHNGLGNT